MRVLIDNEFFKYSNLIEEILPKKSFEKSFFIGNEITTSEIKSADAILCRSVTKLNQEFLKDSKISVIASATSGTDHISDDLINSKNYKTFFSSQIPSTIAVKLDDTNRLNFFNELLSNIGILSEAIIDPQQVRKISLEIFDNTFKISFQLALITLIVASFTLYTNLISINKLRKKDLLPVYLMGFSAKQVIALEILKIFILTNVVSFLSIGMGLIITFILSEIINMETNQYT